MTARQIFEATAIELSKIQAPSLMLQEFNYYFNKAINQYINKTYNYYDVNQQTTDDLRVLKSTAYLTPQKYNPDTQFHGSTYLSSKYPNISSLHGATYEVNMPIDYLHLLNCVCVYYVAKTKDCWDAGSYIQIPATRLTADSWSQILTDVYNRPSPMKPYYYIHNQSVSKNSELLPTNPITEVSDLGIPNGTDMTGTYEVTSNGDTSTSYEETNETFFVYRTLAGKVYVCKTTGQDYQLFTGKLDTDKKYIYPGYVLGLKQSSTPAGVAGVIPEQYTVLAEATTIMEYPNPENTVATSTTQKGSNFPRTLKLDLDASGTAETNVSLVEKPIALRAGNPSNVRLEIRYGRDDSVFQLVEVQVDYVKSPQFIRLTQEQLDLTEDTSQIMEFPDYVNQEIINELVHLVMEHNNDPRLSNNISLSTTIARPTGQQSQTARA